MRRPVSRLQACSLATLCLAAEIAVPTDAAAPSWFGWSAAGNCLYYASHHSHYSAPKLERKRSYKAYKLFTSVSLHFN